LFLVSILAVVRSTISGQRLNRLHARDYIQKLTENTLFNLDNIKGEITKFEAGIIFLIFSVAIFAFCERADRHVHSQTKNRTA